MAAGTTFQTLKGLAPTISVGMLTADLMALGSDLALLGETDVRLLHFDVMDGRFCPMMTFGPPVIKAVKTQLLKDVHLMVTEPLGKLADYVAVGADIVTVPFESEPTHIHRVFQSLGKMTNANDPERGIVRGLAINPGTPVEVIEPLLNEIEMIMLLAINPGWGGQSFIESTRERLARVRQIASGSGRDILIGVDGGITKDNITDVVKMDVDLIVTGSAVFDGKAPRENAKYMLDALKGG